MTGVPPLALERVMLPPPVRVTPPLTEMSVVFTVALTKRAPVLLIVPRSIVVLLLAHVYAPKSSTRPWWHHRDLWFD